MELPITTFDGIALGTFTETGKRKTDTYSDIQITKWYGWFQQRVNNRTNFVLWSVLHVDTLREAISFRLNGLGIFDEMSRRELVLSETQFNNMLNASQRASANASIQGLQGTMIAGNALAISGLNELAVITTIDRYAYPAPPEVKLAAGVEYATWLLRQPAASNRVNALVRSGAATLLDPYRHRGI